MATTNDLKNGMVLKIDNQLWQVVEFQHVKPGKGPAFVRTKMKNVLSGKTIDKTFNAGVKVETATVDRRDMSYLYNDGEFFVFMDDDNYEQVEIPEDIGTKPATVETGAEIQVPLFLEQGTKVKVDTRTGEYVSRVTE